MKKPLALLWALAAASLCSVSMQAKSQVPSYYAYEVVGPATDPAGQASANGVNASGQVFGTWYGSQGWRGFITGPNGKDMITLGTLGGVSSEAFAANSSGQVVGASHDGKRTRAFITGPNGRGMRAIRMPTEDYVQARATGINDRGQVVGIYDGEGIWHGFITDPGGINARDVAGLNADHTTLDAINNLGQAAGQSQQVGAPGEIKVFLTGADGVGLVAVWTNDRAGKVNAVNDSGLVGGYVFSSEDGYSHPFLAEPGKPLEIRTTFTGKHGHLRALNGQGDYVGEASPGTGSRDGRASMSARHSREVNINKYVVNLPAGERLSQATGINDARQIVATAKGRSYLLCPTEDCK